MFESAVDSFDILPLLNVNSYTEMQDTVSVADANADA